MSKELINSETWRDRTGSFSTHGSRRGTNLLGWDHLVREVLSLEQQRESLLKALRAAEEQRKNSEPESAEYEQIGARINSICHQLQAIKKMGAVAHKYQNLGDHLIAMFKERVTRVEWMAIVEEAQRRHDSQACLSELNAMLAESGSFMRGGVQ
ncbi:hypothetical protein [Burkholderia anthina]|uniref:hypothetical protein n=1 Tax=Burkholderia anthina TaxID=179879 RepID=UPI001AA02898|nr:hypothetical protein [Burkholderia anthina]QTD95626.1 hypothetical protein J4G50_38980 [Burkholderia anthina]QTD95648.1 hypothetical protein J4G50_39110 [Burkholderia anthina]